MELESILLTIILFIMGVFLTFYVIDLLRLKVLKSKIPTNNFLGKLKHSIIREVNSDKKSLFLASLIFTIFFILLLLIEPPIHNKIYSSNYDNLMSLNSSQINKTTEKMKESAQQVASSKADRISFLIKGYLVLLPIGISFIFIFYIKYKLNRHFKMEEAIKKDTLEQLLKSLGINQNYISFYKAIEEKYGDSDKDEVYSSFASFIYETIPSKSK